MENTAEQLEHIEHTKHAAHNSFDKKVAMTMAIVAAALAAVTLASHRSHTETLQYQTEAGIKQNEATNKWGYYQAKNIRRHEYEASAKMLASAAKAPGQEKDAEDTIADWKKKSKQYSDTDLPKLEEEAKDLEKEVKTLKEESHHAHERGTRFDLGELGIELSLVLCSLAVLTKRAAFWFSGMAIGVVGAAVALTAFLITAHH